MLGDNIYGDTEDMTILKKKYAKLEAVDTFRKLRKNTIMLATWDDHDYGVNDGGNTYSKRKQSEQIFLNFFKDPANSPRRQREGVYASYTFGKKGKVCQILLLDTRYFRDVLPKNRGKKKKNTVGWYKPTTDTSKTLLGDAQWKWIEEQLQVPADVRIIASSIQMIAVEKGMENWGLVPHEEKRLYDMLKKYECNHTFVISGDVHFTELSKKDIDGYPLYDLTSSGVTHTHAAWAKCTNSFRVGKAHAVHNAGIIDIDWEKETISLRAITDTGESLINHPVSFKELTFKK